MTAGSTLNLLNDKEKNILTGKFVPINSTTDLYRIKGSNWKNILDKGMIKWSPTKDIVSRIGEAPLLGSPKSSLKFRIGAGRPVFIMTRLENR